MSELTPCQNCVSQVAKLEARIGALENVHGLAEQNRFRLERLEQSYQTFLSLVNGPIHEARNAALDVLQMVTRRGA